MRKQVWTAGWIVLGITAVLTAGQTGAEGRLPESPEKIRPLLIGANVPDVGLRTADGEETSLYQTMGGKPSVLILYRGGW